MDCKKLFSYIIFFLIIGNGNLVANPKSVGKFKNWESFTLQSEKGKICFAQTIPAKRVPSSFKREESRLFVTFRPAQSIQDEVSLTSGHIYKASTVRAKSGKKSFDFFSQDKFAWLLDNREEKNFIKLMKKATNLMIIARANNGTETTDHYSMMGFTKAYNTAKKSCS
tara:strand:+ start:45 stop:548 length:504 start_codon:yes stop_codon:yes gene_type:complete